MRVLPILLLISLVACIPQSASPIEDYKQARHLFCLLYTSDAADE